MDDPALRALAGLGYPRSMPRPGDLVRPAGAAGTRLYAGDEFDSSVVSWEGTRMAQDQIGLVIRPDPVGRPYVLLLVRSSTGWAYAPHLEHVL